MTTIDELTLTVTVTIRLRADVHGWRLDPPALPRNGNPQSAMVSSVHSRADFTASGTISRNDAPTRTTTTITWSGSGGIANAIGTFFVTLGGLLSWDTRVLSFVSLSVQGGGVHQQRKVVEQFDMLPVNDSILPAPPQRVRRRRVSWPGVRPDFPPRADFGGT